MSDNPILDAAVRYSDQGLSPIPLKAREKKPTINKWSERDIPRSEFQSMFSASGNIGLRLGEIGGHLIDFDCDWPEAAAICRKLLIDWSCFGRQSSPFSHYMALCPDAKGRLQYSLKAEIAKKLGLKPGDKAMVLEVRANGHQTMAPPSIHPSGEPVRWQCDDPFALPTITWQEVERLFNLIVLLSLVLRLYPTSSGNRDEICWALTGTLLKAGLGVEMIDELVEYIAEQKGDEEASNRRKAESIKQRLGQGQEVAGLTRLCQVLDIEELHDDFRKRLYGKNNKKAVALTSDENADIEAAVSQLNEKFFVLLDEGGQCLVASHELEELGPDCQRWVLKTQTFANFRNRYMNIMFPVQRGDKVAFESLANIWLSHRRRKQYDKAVFRPNQTVDNNVYNLWQGYSVKPVKGSWRRMLRHIRRILSQRDREAFRYIMMWAAWAAQNPDKPAEVALVFRGGKGSGKGTFCRWLTLLFGQHGLQIFASSHLTGRFNSHLRDCILLFSDEAVAANDRDAESVLKGLITEPRITVEMKGKDLITVTNHLHVMMASNSKWIVPATGDERRFAVFDVSSEIAQQKDWFRAIDTEMRSGGAEAMLYTLLNLDLGDWHPRDNVPATKALNDQQIASLEECDRVWFDALATGEVIGNDYSRDRMSVPTADFAKQAGVSAKAAGEYLKAMGCTQNHGARPRAWITPALSEARKRWDETRFKYRWDNGITGWPGADVPF